MTTSGTTLFAPSIADLIVECFARLQIYAPELQTQHIAEARRSANLILSDWSANRSVNLWAVEPLHIALTPGRAAYQLPPDTIQLLDLYTRQYSPAATVTTLGNTLTVMTAGGVPVISALGDPAVIAPGSGTFSATLGSQIMSLRWPAHGLTAGDPIFLDGIVSIGGLALSRLLIVDSVIDSDNVSFLAPLPARETQSLQGATPLLQTTSGSASVLVIYPSHGLSVGDNFDVWASTSVGGLTLSGDYAVASVSTPYQFTITADANASSTAVAFIDAGQIKVRRQSTTATYTDLVIDGLSRSEYAAIPEKTDDGRPTSFWYERVIPPSLRLWPVPPDGEYFGLVAYRMRQIEDANPVSGQTPDMPNRFLPAFTAELTAALAEKFRPDLLKDKMALALAAWPRAAQEDRELVPLYIAPGLSGYFR